MKDSLVSSNLSLAFAFHVLYSSSSDKGFAGSFQKRHYCDQGRVAEIRTQAIVHHSLWDWYSVVRKDISSNNLYLPVSGRVHLGNRNRVRL